MDLALDADSMASSKNGSPRFGGWRVPFGASVPHGATAWRDVLDRSSGSSLSLREVGNWALWAFSWRGPRGLRLAASTPSGRLVQLERGQGKGHSPLQKIILCLPRGSATEDQEAAQEALRTRAA